MTAFIDAGWRQIIDIGNWFLSFSSIHLNQSLLLKFLNYNEAPLLVEITGLPTGKAAVIVETNVKELKVHSVKSKKENGVEQTNQSPKVATQVTRGNRLNHHKRFP